MKYITKDNINTIKNTYYLQDISGSLFYQEDLKNFILNQDFEIDFTNYNIKIEEIRNRLKNNKDVKLFNFGSYYKDISPTCFACRDRANKFYTMPATLHCNKSCFFCSIDLNQDMEVDINEVDRAFKLKGGMEHFAISGGEPLLETEIVYSLFNRINDLNPNCRIRLYTNGDLWSGEINERLIELGVNEIRLSIKQEDLDNHDYIINKINQIHGIEVIIEMPVFPNDEEKMISLFNSLRRTSIRGINILEFYYYLENGSEQFNNYDLKIGFSNEDFYESIYQPFSVAKSSWVCYKLIEYAAEKELPFFVHHCTTKNSKTLFNNYYDNENKHGNFEYLSSTSYIIEASVGGMDAVYTEQEFKKNSINFILENRQYPYITFNPQNIDYVVDGAEVLLKFYTYKNGQKIFVKTATTDKTDSSWK